MQIVVLGMLPLVLLVAQSTMTVANACALNGADCRNIGCCADPKMTCFQKNEGWASCMSDCTPGPHPWEEGKYAKQPWSCIKLTFGIPGVFEQCGGGEGWVGQTRCKPGCHCHKTSNQFSQCRPNNKSAVWCFSPDENKPTTTPEPSTTKPVANEPTVDEPATDEPAADDIEGLKAQIEALEATAASMHKASQSNTEVSMLKKAKKSPESGEDSWDNANMIQENLIIQANSELDNGRVVQQLHGAMPALRALAPQIMVVGSAGAVATALAAFALKVRGRVSLQTLDTSGQSADAEEALVEAVQAK